MSQIVTLNHYSSTLSITRNPQSEVTVSRAPIAVLRILRRMKTPVQCALLIDTLQSLFPCISQPIENPRIPAKCFVSNSWNRWASASGNWRRLFMFRTNVSTALLARQINLKSGRFFDFQRFPQWNSNLISAA